MTMSVHEWQFYLWATTVRCGQKDVHILSSRVWILQLRFRYGNRHPRRDWTWKNWARIFSGRKWMWNRPCASGTIFRSLTSDITYKNNDDSWLISERSTELLGIGGLLSKIVHHKWASHVSLGVFTRFHRMVWVTYIGESPSYAEPTQARTNYFQSVDHLLLCYDFEEP